ncbi:unnamed protein product [Rotaria sp. Silwood1]|nr:unnamed protein product [Rotaria sp. Silwood1]CAF1502889.1 unnamed protein product [Rotaria sp. Silwood1]CAF3675635.1 unnamed protein product [Rotaria sp. Silwood1]CAF4592933.1 unnamed protein product [Rotaria sp. Silwood1]
MIKFSSAVLYKEQEQFLKQKAESTTSCASKLKRQDTDKTSSQKTSQMKSKLDRSKTYSDFRTNYDSSSTSSKSPFLMLKNIVEKLQERFSTGQNDPLTLDEIIQECSLTINSSDKHWLASQALLSNEKIDVKTIDGIHRFVYKPALDLKDPKKSSILKLLKARHENCEGAITVEDVRDSIEKLRADKIIESVIANGHVVKVKSNKREVLFYTDNDPSFRINPKFIDSWRKISVEHLTNEQISGFIDQKGHYSLTTNAPKQLKLQKPLKRGCQGLATVKHNQHIADQLKDYSNSINKK